MTHPGARWPDGPHACTNYGTTDATGWADRSLRAAASALHSALCPPFQCAIWQSRPQYIAALQPLHFNSLPADAAAPAPAAMSAVARPQWLQLYSREWGEETVKGRPG